MLRACTTGPCTSPLSSLPVSFEPGSVKDVQPQLDSGRLCYPHLREYVISLPPINPCRLLPPCMKRDLSHPVERLPLEVGGFDFRCKPRRPLVRVQRFS